MGRDQWSKYYQSFLRLLLESQSLGQVDLGIMILRFRIDGFRCLFRELRGTVD